MKSLKKYLLILLSVIAFSFSARAQDVAPVTPVPHAFTAQTFYQFNSGDTTYYIKSPAGWAKILRFKEGIHLIDSLASAYFVTGLFNGSGTLGSPYGLAAGSVAMANIAATGSPGSSTVLYGDGVWRTVSGGGGGAWGTITGTLSSQSDLAAALAALQATLVSGTNIKTVNSVSLLGSGNIALQAPLVSGTDYEVPLTFSSGVTRTVNAIKLDTTFAKSKVGALADYNVLAARIAASATNITTLQGQHTSDYAATGLKHAKIITANPSAPSSTILTGDSTNMALWKLQAQVNANGTNITSNTASIVTKAASLVPTTVKTSAYTAAVNDFVPVNTTSGAVTITLPTAPADKSLIGIKMVIQGGTNVVNLALGGSDVFNKTGGSTTGVLTLLNQGVLLQYNASGAIWYVLSDDLALAQLDLRYQKTLTAGTNITISGTTISASGGTVSLPFLLATDYGVVADSTTDNTTAMRAAITACPTAGCTLMLPAGRILISDSLLINKPIHWVGQGGVNQFGASVTAITAIIQTGAAKKGFYINSNNCSIDNICFKNSNTATAGSVGIYLNKSVGFTMTNSSIIAFYDNVDFENGYDRHMDNIRFILPVHNNLIIRDIALPDAGDDAHSNLWFYSNVTTSGVFQIQYTSGGGLKLNNIKLNTTSGGYYGGINASMNLVTIDFILTAYSIENFTTVGVKIAPTANTGNINITSGQMGTASDANCVLIDASGASVSNLIISANTFSNSNATKYCIESDYTSSVTYGPNNYGLLGKSVHIGAHSPNSPTIIRSNLLVNLSGTTPNYDVGKSQSQILGITANSTLSFTNFQSGDNAVLYVYQDGTGGRTLAFSGGAFLNGVIDTRPNALSIVHLYNSSPYIFIESFGARPKQTSSAAGTLTLTYGTDYVFTGTTATYTLPAILAGINGNSNRITIYNRGSGTITVNSAAGGNDIYNTAAAATFALTAGTACTLTPDGTYLLYKAN